MRGFRVEHGRTAPLRLRLRALGCERPAPQALRELLQRRLGDRAGLRHEHRKEPGSAPRRRRVIT
jgi:hypothetical protein